MAKAIVLLSVYSGTDTEVINELKQIDNVKQIYEVYGAYDIIVMMEGNSQSTIKETIFEKVRRLTHIKSTLTMMVVED